MIVRPAEAIRRGIRAGGRFRDASGDIRASAGTVANDPLEIVIDTRAGGYVRGSADPGLDHVRVVAA